VLKPAVARWFATMSRFIDARRRNSSFLSAVDMRSSSEPRSMATSSR